MRTAVLSPYGELSPVTEAALDASERVSGLGVDVAATLEWCLEVAQATPLVGGGATRQLWDLLASTAARNVSAARMLEPHLDALSILSEAGTNPAAGRDPWGVGAVGAGARSTWGVFAAEGAGMRLEATERHDGWSLSGTKPWCSLAADLSHALVTAFVGADERRLFAVDLRAAQVRTEPGDWFARGLPHVVSGPVQFDGAPAVPVGESGWYLSRPGFARGGMSVAACWWGGAVGVADALVAAAASDRADQLALVHLGRTDAALWAARAALAEAADLVDDASGGVDERLVAGRVRSAVVDAATLTLAEADAALGPAPLVRDRDHAARVADLHLYLRQHHGPRDLAGIGRAVAAQSA